VLGQCGLSHATVGMHRTSRQDGGVLAGPQFLLQGLQEVRPTDETLVRRRAEAVCKPLRRLRSLLAGEMQVIVLLGDIRIPTGSDGTITLKVLRRGWWLGHAGKGLNR
jgi:hypothetical protein